MKPAAADILPPQLVNDLQCLGLRLEQPGSEAADRRGGAGPSDHRAVILDGRTVMIPIATAPAHQSPYVASQPDADGTSLIQRDGATVATLQFRRPPRFYGLKTEDGIPYSHLATLHASDVLATTVLQSCIRYGNRATSCQFCAIGQSLEAGRTILRKTPQQLAEVARAAVELDGVKHMVMTTGTPNLTDRGARILCESAEGVKAAVDLPIQGQCEPPDHDVWFERMKSSGVDSLGMHLEAVTPDVRARIMPGKASVALERYLDAFDAAVAVFGRGQVTTYILAGLGDSAEAILSLCDTLIGKGVYPFVVPFVPIAGTPLEHHAAPDPALLRQILEPLADRLKRSGLLSSGMKAGCAKCGACSALSSLGA